MTRPDLNIGDVLSVQKIITKDDVAQKTGSGCLTELLGTPSLIDLMISASAKLIDTKLDEGFISVGKSMSIIHESPSVVGDTITLSVEVADIEHNHIELKVTAWDELGLVGTGTHIRTIVNDEWLMIKLKRHRASLENKNF